MNELILTNTGGFPLRQDRLKFMQKSLADGINNLGQGPKIIGFLDSISGDPVMFNAYVITGCKITENGNNLDVEPGVIYHDKEVLEVPGHTLQKGTGNFLLYHFALEIIDDGESVREYADGNSHPTERIRRAKLTFTNFANAGDLLNATIQWPLTKLTVNSSNWTTANYLMSHLPLRRRITMINGWQNSHDGDIIAFRYHDKRVQVICNAVYSPTGGAPTNGIIGQLPIGYRPAVNVQFYYGEFFGSRTWIEYRINGDIVWIDSNDNETDALAASRFELNHWFETK